jgi:hypothetical protein
MSKSSNPARVGPLGPVIIAVLVLGGACSGDSTATTQVANSTADTISTTTLETVGPPCFGLLETGIPEWAAAFQSDLVTYCQVEGGVISVNRDNRVPFVYVDSCEAFNPAEIPADLQPAGDDWSCIDPG